MYLRLVNADLAQPAVDAAASETPVSQPSVAGGDPTMLMLAQICQIMQQMVAGLNRAENSRSTLSQKDAANLIAAVPSVAPNGVVLSGSKLIAWFKEANDTYLLEQFWTSAFAFNALAKLFDDAPDLLATWRQVTQSDERVIQARIDRDWKSAWNIVSASMIIAHTVDRHEAQRIVLKPQGHLFQHPDKTV